MDNEPKSVLPKAALAGGLVSLLVTGGVIYFASPKVEKQVVRETIREVVKEGEELGAFPGPVFTEQDLTIGGVRKQYIRQDFRQATSTICAIPKPHRATATLDSLVINWYGGSAASSTATDGTTGRTVLESVIGWEDTATSTRFATTSLSAGIGTPYTIRASSTFAIIASSTAGGPESLVSTSTFGYVLVKLSNPQYGLGDWEGFAPRGYCDVVWNVLQ